MSSQLSPMNMGVSQGVTGDGTARKVAGMRDKTLQISGTFVATVSVKGSIDGTNFVEVASVTGVALVQIPQTLLLLRVDITWTSGQPAAVLAGFSEG